MKMIKLQLLAAAACLAMSGLSHAATVTGDLGYFAEGGTFNDTSFTFNNITESFTTSSDGNFAGGTISFDVPGLTGLQVNSGAQAENVNLLTITTATDSYQFDLSSLTTTDSSGFLNYVGTGTLVDNDGVLASSPATISMGSQSGAGFFQFGVSATPEPSSWALGAIACAVLVFLRRAKRA